MSGSLKKLPVAFYRTASGDEPVREWLKALPAEDRLVIGEDIKTVEYGWPIGMPICRPFGQGLWEVRSNLPSNRTARVLFCPANGRLVLLHAFFKTTQRTPPGDLAVARERQALAKERREDV